MAIDTALVGAPHVEYLRKREVGRIKHPHQALFQTSTIDALLSGNYDGDVSFAELQAGGDVGLGTFDALDGEVVALDGNFYQVKADGRAYEVDGRLRTPFAVVTFFEPDLRQPLAGPMGYADLCTHLDRLVGDANVCHALRVDGLFHYVKTRSVPRQRKPYPPLVEVVKYQPTLELRDIRSSLVGFRFPDCAHGLNVPAYHLHYVTEDRQAGGHLLECQMGPRRASRRPGRGPTARASGRHRRGRAQPDLIQERRAEPSRKRVANVTVLRRGRKRRGRLTASSDPKPYPNRPQHHDAGPDKTPY